MKKLLIATLVLIAAYAVGAAVFAVASGQSEGKIISEQKQLLTDGDMEASDTSAWTVFQITPSKEYGAAKEGARVLRLTYDGSHSSGLVYQTIFTTGNEYRITGWARGDGTGRPRIQDGLGGILWIGTTSADWQRVDVHGVAAHSRIYLYGELLSASKYVEFDDIFATEYIGKIKDANKQLLTDADMESPPTLVANGLADNDMENAGTADWAVVSGATLSKETGSPHGGSQVLRVVEDTGYGSARAAVSPVVEGTTYIVRGYARSDGTRYPILSQDLIGDTWGGTTDTDWQYFSVLFESLNGYIYFGLKSTGAPGGYVEFDDITVQEVTDAGTSAWTAENDAVLTKEPGAAKEGGLTLRVSFNGTNHPNARQSVLTVGEKYRITGWARGDGGSAYPQVLNSATGEWTGTVSTDWQRVDAVFTAQDTYIRLKTSAYAQGNSEWDDILVTEL